MLEYQSPMIDSRALNELPDHSMQRRGAEVEFFAEPPAEIGKVRSAESTLKPGREPMTFPVWLLLGVLVAGAIVFGGYYLGHGKTEFDREFFQWPAYFLGALALGITLLATRFKVVCSFVGEQGTASFTLKGRRDGQPKVQLLQFAQAEELRAKQIRQSYHGIYLDTSYDYSWNGSGGKRLWRIKGSYRQRKKGLRAGQTFRYVEAAEISWSQYFLERAQKCLEAEGSIPFRVDNRRVVRVGRGFMEFHFGDEPVRLTHEDMASVSLASGTFQFKHKDAKWYSLSGKYSFQYGNMANARVFLLALEKLVGYRWN